jgi:hypothetical protein
MRGSATVSARRWNSRRRPRHLRRTVSGTSSALSPRQRIGNGDEMGHGVNSSGRWTCSALRHPDAAREVKLGLATAENERDRGDCTPSSARSNTGGCCARVAERRAEHLGLPIYIWAGSCASAAPGRRKKMRLLWFGWATRWAAGRDRRGSSWVSGLAAVQH